jgi:hypothetical protein
MSIGRHNFQISERVRTHAILIYRSTLKRNRIVTEKKLDDLGNQLANSSRKSLGRIGQQSGASVGSAWTTNKLLHIRPYKITIVLHIKPMDYGKRVRISNWFVSANH